MPIDGGPLTGDAPPAHRLLRAGLEAAPDEVAIVSAARRMTWRELDERSAALAAAYRGLGLEPGDRVASLMPNRIVLARPLPRVLPGRARGHAAQLPLHRSARSTMRSR